MKEAWAMVEPSRLVRVRERVIGSASLLLRASEVSQRRWRSGAVAFLYHRVVDATHTSDPFSVTLTEFERQVEWLAKHYTLVTANDLSHRHR